MDTWLIVGFFAIAAYNAGVLWDLTRKVDRLQAQVEHLHRQLVK